ncbi:MAG: MATE family efflux transporter [Rhabdochlamydiaceae bacterium]|nr:MATE family efflux transporter [Candidatus Amphrikana amoebophyrae]
MSDIKRADVKQLWKVTFPLMISFMSTFAMLFVDRLFLSLYSKDALNAAAISGTLSWSFIVAWMTLAALAEVFVAQYNGANRKMELARPVWQMIWLAGASVIFFSLASQFLTGFIYSGAGEQLHRDYFSWLMLCGPFAVIISGISAFYIGRGHGKVIKWLSILANLVNIVLDPILIFGVNGVIPSMGIKGAAIATFSGYLVQAIVITCLFLSKRNREKYGTNNYRFDFDLCKRCFKIGFPPALFAGLEILAWAIFYTMMQWVSPEHIFVCSVCQSIEMLFLFYCFGLEKGVAAVAGNLIGAKMHDQIKVLVKSAFKLIVYFAITMTLITIIYPDPLINLFLQQETAQSTNLVLTSAETLRYKGLIRISLVFVTLYLIFESIRWLYSGLLTAAGDTLYIMISGVISVWLFLLVPCYFFIVVKGQSIIFAFVIWTVYSIIATLLNFLRFKNGAWKNKVVIEDETAQEQSNDNPLSTE